MLTHGVVSQMSGGSQIRGWCVQHLSPALAHLQLGHASPDLCTSYGASQSGAESQRLGVGSGSGLGLLEAILVLPQLSGQEPSPQWLLEGTMLFHSLALCPALPWVGAKKQLQGSDPGIGDVPKVGRVCSMRVRGAGPRSHRTSAAQGSWRERRAIFWSADPELLPCPGGLLSLWWALYSCMCV